MMECDSGNYNISKVESHMTIVKFSLEPEPTPLSIIAPPIVTNNLSILAGTIEATINDDNDNNG